MNENKKTSRARAPEKKAEQFNKIIETGKELFVKYGAHGFSLRALARALNMSQSNLYNYVKSKRELWIAIRIKYFSEFQKGFVEQIKKHGKNYTELWLGWAEHFLDFAAADHKRFEMMFFVRAPPSEKKGEYEEKFKPLQIMKQGINIGNQAIKEGKIKKDTPAELFYYMYGSCIGAAKVEADLKLNLIITEPLVVESDMVDHKKFREFFLKEFRDRVERIQEK